MKKVISDTNVPIKIWASDLEEEAEKQLRNVASLPFIYKNVAVMPDAHAGKGSTVGTVIATQGAIIPAAVGVDIGCGMCAMKLPFKVDVLKDLPKLRHSIERSVPTGKNANKNATDSASASFLSLGDVSQTAKEKMRSGVLEKALLSIGTLGGGNHFIEICKDQEDNAWIMLHSGSRNIGKCLAEIHIDRAKELMKEYFISLPDPDLAYLAQNTPEFKSYLQDLMWGQRFAMSNRNEMMDRVLREVLYHVGMLDKYLEYSESFCSCSHGAGRKMSRTKARETFSLEDLAQQTAGVECRKDKDIIDEIPGSYKSIDEVMTNQADLVTPVFELKQLLCIKGD